MNIFRFLDWQMYKDARVFNFEIEHLTRELPCNVRKKYDNQINRSALSICLNIAEGTGRYSDAELCRFFDIALGSISETVACLDILKNCAYISEKQFNNMYKQALNVAKQIQGMKNNIQKKSRMIKKDAKYLTKN